ncbi:hypothetical protein F4777DRAFT_570207 [Nemania sp. FL0916]|nr:hypothetical protein F4777DRAFT_570207 [Nemania sp. FL0916]
MSFRLSPYFYLIVIYLSACYVRADRETAVTQQCPERALPQLGAPYSGLIIGENQTQVPSDLSVETRSGAKFLNKRQREEDPTTGAELCMKAPCVDGSCCGPAGICGYGPDFCGDGCTSNCDATASCGQYSVNGSVSCGLNLCCSWGGWCGTTEAHCIEANAFTPCQVGYGLCEIIRPKPCGEDSGTTNGRSIGYYQASSAKNRICNRITPDQIETDGYTHLFYAFATVDPVSFELKPSDEEDIYLMTAFTALKTSTMQTWISVGGYDFSDVGQPTHTTWSDLCADAGRRADFISSAIQFMDHYGFQGMDIDWEYPVAPERGGHPDDTKNFVQLVKEMRAAFGTKYGLSLILAPDYWYLRNFDPKAMEPYVDFFGFIAYDLHGYWDSDVLALGALVRGQTDVREIYNDTLPLFYDDLDPAKVNFGLAWYGRGYTLADPSCSELLCPFKAPSKPGKCTGTPGVLSLREIQQIIAERGLTPRLNTDSVMKELVFADQWIGYDDDETHAMKRKFANNLCFGGTIAWSVDFNSGPGSGDQPPVSTDGSCGPDNGGTVCEGSGFGDCCSAHGYCGSGSDYCGSGCLSGECVIGGETTDGMCGAAYNDVVCGLWPQGSCCSSAGYCGGTTDHCGPGCQSGPCLQDPDGTGSGDVYIDNTVYVQPSPTVQCFPPCTLVFPPSTITTVTTFSFAPVTTALTVGGSVTTTIIRPSPVTTSVIWFSNLPIPSGKSTSDFALTSSIKPDPIVVTLNGVTSTLSLPATLLLPTTTSTSTNVPPVFYSLPTTVYSTSGTTQTFSEDQITTLSKLSSTSTSTTTWTDDQTSTTSTTVAPIIIGPGGFYWSPVPQPSGPNRFPIPNLPKPPPIPDPPCFKLFDIFSIDCPPDHNKPTSHYTRGPPKPTCTGNCGKVDDPSDENESTSTCATETHTTCQTRDGSATCNTYVGCDCPTSTVTDVWVSCHSESCTTTSSSVITGCYITPTATTTGDYCPLFSDNPALQEVGDMLPPGASITYAPVAYPPSVAVGTSWDTGTSGTVVVGGSTITVVSITVTMIITVDGTTATLYPATTRNRPGINDWASWGLKPPSSSTTTTSKDMPTTTSSSPPPPETHAPPGARPVWVLAGQSIPGSGSFPVSRFTFNGANLDDFDPNTMVLNPCNLNSDWEIEAPGGIDDLDTDGLDDITDVFGDTCAFVSAVGGKDWEDIDYGTVVGHLQRCGKWSDAECVKYELEFGNTADCGGGVKAVELALCTWG